MPCKKRDEVHELIDWTWSWSFWIGGKPEHALAF